MAGLFGRFVSGRAAMGLLLFRLVAGTGLAMHGWQKAQNGFTTWMGPDAPYPEWLVGMSTVAELGGGIALILGVLTPLAAMLISANFVFALNSHFSRGDAFIGGYELALVYLAAGVMMILTGPGTISLDALFFGQRTAQEHGDRPVRTEEEEEIRKRAKLM